MSTQYRKGTQRSTLLARLLMAGAFAALSACGGGGGDAPTTSETDSTSPTTTTPTPNAPAPTTGTTQGGTTTPASDNSDTGAGTDTGTGGSGSTGGSAGTSTNAARRLAASGTEVRVVSDSAGNALVAWLASDGTRRNIYGARYLVNGGWQPAVVIDDTDSDLSRFSISMAGNGNVLLGWSQPEQDIGRARVRMFVNGAWEPSQVISQHGDPSTQPGGADRVYVAIDNSGRAVAVWAQPPYLGSASRIMLNRFAPGSGWGTASSIGGPYIGGMEVKMDGNGNAAVVWTNEGTSEADMHAAYIVGAGGMSNKHMHVGPFSAQAPTVVLSANGSAVALWSQNSYLALDYSNAYASLYTPGVGWSDPQEIDTTDTDVALVRGGADSNGNVVALWRQDGRLVSRTLRSGVWGATQDVTGSGTQLVVAGGSGGSAFAAWEQTDNGTPSIWFARYDGSTWGAAAPVETNAGTAGMPDVSTHTGAAAVFAWQQTDGVWATRR